MIGKPCEFGVPAHFDRSLKLVKVDVQDPSRCHWLFAQALTVSPQSLRATLSQASPRLVKCLAAFGELVVHIVGVEQCEQGGGVRVEVAAGTRVVQQHANVPVVQHHRRVEPHLRVAVRVRKQREMGVHEFQPVASVGEQSLQWRRPWPQRWRAEEHRLLLDLLVLVEQHDHQPGPAAEPPEQCALADTGGRGDVVRRDGVGAALRDQATRSVQQ